MPKKETIITDLNKLNKLQLKYFGYTIEEFLEMDKESLTPDEIETLALHGNSFYTEYFERVINKLIALEMKNFAEQAVNEQQLLFYRGSLAGLLTVKQWFLDQKVLASKKMDRAPEEILNPNL